MSSSQGGSVLIVGASRGIGLGLAAEFAQRGWRVVGTARGGRTELHTMAEDRENVAVKSLDFTDDTQLDSVAQSLPANSFDILFVVAGVYGPESAISAVGRDEFSHVLIANALAPMHTVERLRDLVTHRGTIAVMTSRLGSVGDNTSGEHETYRASKAALNQLMRSYDARRDDQRTILLVHPGWVRTELGGHDAPLSVERSAGDVINVVLRHREDGDLQYRDHQDQVVTW